MIFLLLPHSPLRATMARFSMLWACLWTLGYISTLVASQDIIALKQALEDGGVETVFPDEAEYEEASGACEYAL